MATVKHTPVPSSSPSATALLCLSKTKNDNPNCFRITMDRDSYLAVTKVVVDEPTSLEPMEYTIKGKDVELRKRLISHIVDKYAVTGPENVWEVIDLED